MSKKVAPRVQLNFEPELSDVVEEDITLNEEQDLDMPMDMPEVIERDKIVENDIFDLKMKENVEDLIIEEAEPLPTPQPKQTQAKQTQAKPKPPEKQTQPQAKQTQAKQTQAKQTKKTKTGRKLSEEHKAKLALAREKALVTRRKNAEEKKKMKEIEKQTKELKKKKAQKDLKQLEDEVINDKPVKSVIQQGTTFTKEDLENAQLDAIMKYEAIRKARKEEKKKQQMIDNQKKELQKKIQGYGARDNNGRLLNKWDRCY